MFDDTGDFSSRGKKMKALLVQHMLQLAIQDLSTLGSSITDIHKKEMQKSAFSILVFYLTGNMLRQIDGEEIAYGDWNKLEELFVEKSLTNIILLKERFFGFHIDPGKNLEQNLDEFKKMAISLASVDDEKIGDESQAIILLNSLPNSYKEVKAAIKFGRKTITLDEVISALRSWELEMKNSQKTNGSGESLNVRGRPNNRNQSSNRGKLSSKSRGQGNKWWKKVKCYNCQEIGHTK